MTVARSDVASLAVQLEDTWASLLALGRQLGPGEWSLSTPCPGWDVRDQYAHVLGVESLLAGDPPPRPVASPGAHVRNPMGGINESWVEPWRARPTSELLDALADVTARRLAALSAMTQAELDAPADTPVGRATYGRFMQIRVFDSWVHEQDVRVATDRPGHGDGPAAEQSVDEIERALGYIVAKRAGAPPGSTVGVALAGPVAREMWVEVPVSGRAVVVGEPSRRPDVVVRMSSGTFVALACGRPTTGAVEVQGDQALGRRIVEHLAFTM